MGKWLFPLMEPVFMMLDDIRPDVRRHFERALKSLEKKNMPVGLLNLNMALSLRPNHFLARVYRGRIFLKEKQFRLASVDFIRANKISPYRFAHYELYSEYLESVNEGVGHLGDSMVSNFSRIFETLRQEPDNILYDPEMDDKENGAEVISGSHLAFEGDKLVREINRDLNQEEKDRFQKMGPITIRELEETDWEGLIKKLGS